MLQHLGLKDLIFMNVAKFFHNWPSKDRVQIFQVVKEMGRQWV